MNATRLRLAEESLEQRNLAGAVIAFHDAEVSGAAPDTCAAGRWLAHMLAGEFTLAWRESDAIRGRGAPDPHRFWLGDDLHNQRVVLRCLHGFGDAVQLLRYAPRLRTIASHLVVEVPPAMLEIAPCFDGVEQAVTWGEQAPAHPYRWDQQIELMELPYYFRTQLKELPLATSYLRLPPAVERHAALSMGPAQGLRVGLVWAAGAWNAERSLPFSLLRPLLATVDCDFWSLQGGSARQDGSKLRWAADVHDAALCGQGILALAAAINQLDLVITVDTLAAHLAGALAKPVWILLQHAADWRWMTERTDSPWYPTARLYRQPSPGDWEGVIQSVGHDLAQLAPVRNRS